jgi:Holliday junction resolvase-like predicted endonuclease
MNIDADRSSNHAKITGNFGERLVLYWLSKHGFECAYVDHVGIDIIANNPDTRELMGISVKSRSKARSTIVNETVNIPNTHFGKIEKACRDFRCAPYIAVVVDKERSKSDPSIFTYIVPLKIFRALSHSNEHTTYWSMTPKKMKTYESNRNIRWFKFVITKGNWHKSQTTKTADFKS